MSQITIYTELEFVEAIYNANPINSDHLEFVNDNIKWYSIFCDFFFKKSLVYLDITDEDMEEQLENGNIFLRRLIRNHTSMPKPYPYFSFMREDVDYAENVQPNSIHCYNNGVLTKDTGYITFDYEDWEEKIKILSYSKVLNVSKNEKLNKFISWSKLNVIRKDVPKNAAIIYDPYFSKYFSYKEKNIQDILDLILPEYKIGVPYHLTIITKQGELSIEHLSQKIKELSNFISKNYEADVKVQLCLTHSELHDRGIISNYFWIDSGHSLDMLNERGNVRRNSWVKIFNINEIEFESFTTIILELDQFINRAEIIGDDFKNRLFNLARR